MDIKNNTTAKKNIPVNPYVHFFNTSHCFFKKAKKSPDRSTYQFGTSFVYAAFALESYFNYVGENIIEYWDKLKTLSPENKLDILAENLNVVICYKKYPWKIMKELFSYHYRVSTWKSAKQNTNKYDWLDYCSLENTKKAIENVEEIIILLHTAACFKGFPFTLDHQKMSDTSFDE